MVELIFTLFAKPWLPWVLSALILLGALLIWLDFRHRRLEPVLRGLDEAIAAVEQAGGASAFRKRFSAIYARLAANPIVGATWRAYAPTLGPAPGEREVLGYSRRPQENFNEGLLAQAGVDLRFYNAVPNYLVGIGLFFTFVGLVAALYFASAGVAAAEVQDAQRALRDLLAAATFKFATSIAGLGASIGFSWAEKRQLYRVHRRLARLCAALEERMVPVTPESLAATQLAELKLQSAQLRRIGRNIFITVPQAIEEQLADELKAAIRPMQAALGEAAKRLRHIDRVIADQLTAPEAAGEGEAPVPTTGRGGLVALDGLVAEMRALRGALEGLAGTVPLPAPEPLGTGDGAARLAAFATAIERAAQGLDSLEARLADAVEAVAASLAALSGAAARDAPTPEALAGLKDALAELGEARADLEGLGQAFRALAADSRATLDSGRGGELDPAVADGLARLGAGLHAFNSRMRAFIRKVDERLARALRRAEESSAALAGEPEKDDRHGP